MEELPSLHLVIPAAQGMLSHAGNLLLSPARRINLQIIETMAGINPAALRYISYCSLAGDPDKIKPHDNIESVALRNLRHDQLSIRMFTASVMASPTSIPIRSSAGSRPSPGPLCS